MAKLIGPRVMDVQNHSQDYFLLGGENRSFQLNSPTCHTLQTYSITLYRVHLVKKRIELTTLIATRTEYMSSCKFNYHIITAATVDGLSGVMVSNLFFYICEYSPFSISTLLTELDIKSLYITHSLVNDSICCTI